MAAEPVVAVFDTSVLFGKQSRRVLIEAVRQGHVDGVWSPHIIGELYRVLTIQWLRTYGFDNDSLKRLSRSSKDMMDVLVASLRLVDTGRSESDLGIPLEDPDDFHLIRAARLARATYVVSQNTQDFPGADNLGRHVFENIEFIDYLRFLTRISL